MRRALLLILFPALGLIASCQKIEQEEDLHAVDLNRPFAYAIRETSSDTILLLGTLSE